MQDSGGPGQAQLWSACLALSIWKLISLLLNILLPYFWSLVKLVFNQSVSCAVSSVWWINFSPSSTDAEEKQKEAAVTTVSLVLAGGLRGKIREWEFPA